MDGMSERVGLQFLSCSASKYIIIVVFFIQGSLKKPLLPLLSILSPEEQDEVLYQVINQFLTPSNYNYNLFRCEATLWIYLSLYLCV